MRSADWPNLIARRRCAINFHSAAAFQTDSKHCFIRRYFYAENISAHIFSTEGVEGLGLIKNCSIGIRARNNESIIQWPVNLINWIWTFSEGGKVTPLEGREEEEKENENST